MRKKKRKEKKNYIHLSPIFRRYEGMREVKKGRGGEGGEGSSVSMTGTLHMDRGMN